jgi:hypothetical protein
MQPRNTPSPLASPQPHSRRAMAALFDSSHSLPAGFAADRTPDGRGDTSRRTRRSPGWVLKINHPQVWLRRKDSIPGRDGGSGHDLTVRPPAENWKSRAAKILSTTSWGMAAWADVLQCDRIVSKLFQIFWLSALAFWRNKTQKNRPQLPSLSSEHGSGRPRSKDRHRPQLCAKPRHHGLAAQRAAPSSLPTSGSHLNVLARSPQSRWPDSLAGVGTSAHLDGLRSTRS